MNKDWTNLFAYRAHEMKESEVRALFSVVNKMDADGNPTVVSLAGGMPYVQALSIDTISEVQNRLLREKGGIALQYGSGQGNPLLREKISELMHLEGIKADADSVVVTTGSQSGLDIISKMFLDRGNVVLVESPTYVGALGVFKSYQADIEHVYTDENGMSAEHLETKIKELKAIGKTIKLLYLVPNYNNPTGVVLSNGRRKQIIEIAARHNILIVEDDPYGLLYFNSPPPASMLTMGDRQNIIYLGSFSKTFAPGFRVGWIVAPDAIKKHLILGNEAAVLSPSEFSQLTVSEYLTHTDWEAQLKVFRGVYEERKNTMIQALDKYLPELDKTNPSGGFFVWLDLPKHIDSRALLIKAVENGVAFTPGQAFYNNHDGANHLRLSFSYPTPFYIEKGIRILAETIHQMGN